MSAFIKKEAATKEELYRRAIQRAQDLVDDEVIDDVEEVFILSDARLTSLDFTKGEIKALKGYEIVSFDSGAQANVVLMLKALLIINKLVEEYEQTGDALLANHVKAISEKVKILDKGEDVFGQFKRNFLSVFSEQKRKTISKKLIAVRGKLDTMREIGYAARAMFVVKTLARNTEINDIKGLLDGVNKTAFKGLMDAEDTITGYCGVSNPKGSYNALQGVISKLAREYGPSAKTASESAGIRQALSELKTVREDVSLSVSQKMTKQQEILDGALDQVGAEMIEVLKVLNEAKVLVSDGESATNIGGELGLTKEQEDAMLSDGMTIISAGAGSGKTRVLSGKVAHLIKDKGADPYSIIACSFSRKSAQDLKDKIISATGRDLKNVDYTTIGRTTHSIAIEMMNRFDPEAGSKTIADEFEQNDILKRAIELAKKTAPTRGMTKTESFFKEKISPIPEAQKKNNVRILSMLYNVERWREGRGYEKDGTSSTRLKGIRTQVAAGEAVEAVDQSYVKTILGHNRGQKVLNRAFGGDQKAITKYMSNFSLQPRTKSASGAPTAMWWGFQGQYGDDVKIPSPRKAQLFITKCKARMMSPTEALEKVEGSGDQHEVSAKIYGAYQYLMGVEEKMDFDDVLIRGVQVLNYKQNLDEVRKQYKHIIVDEAQDLNPVQHAFFGLIAGTFEANAGKAPTAVENPTLDSGKSFTLIGDENQSIYGFRGASRGEFTSKVTEGFGLKSIGVNFRSGESIVNAANMLVGAKEGEGLGLVCVASVKKSSDRVTHERKKDSSTSARDVAAHIKKMTTADETDVSPRSFGIACRTNAEIIPYALALLSEGVPFKSGVNPFQHKSTRAIIRLMGFLTESGSAQKSAVLNSWRDFGYNFSPIKYKSAVDAFMAHKGIKTYASFPASISNAMEGVNQGEEEATEALMVFINELEAEMEEVQKVIEFNHSLAVWRKKANKDPAKAFDVVLGYSPIEGSDYFLGEGGKKLFEILSSAGFQVDEIGDSEGGEEDTNEAPAETDETEDAEALALAPISALRTLFMAGTDFDKIFAKIEKMKVDASRNQGKADVDEDVVVLDTVHGWKGLEAEHIYVPMNAGKFPSEKVEFDPILHNDMGEAEKDKAEQEKLLGYVAVTRGMKSVTILSYEKDDKGDDMEPSEFVSQMSICDNSSTNKVASALSVLADLSVEASDDDMSDDDIDEALGIF